MLLTNLAAKILAVDIPKPNTPDEVDAVGGSALGLILGMLSWIALGVAIWNFAFSWRGDKQSRAERSQKALWAIVVYFVLQVLDVVVPALGSIMTTPLDALQGLAG